MYKNTISLYIEHSQRLEDTSIVSVRNLLLLPKSFRSNGDIQTGLVVLKLFIERNFHLSFICAA